MTEPAPDQAAPAGGPPLTREHTAALLQERGTPPAAFHLYGAHVDDAIVLDHRVGGWVSSTANAEARAPCYGTPRRTQPAGTSSTGCR